MEMTAAKEQKYARAFNFNPGPAALPLPVLERINSELYNHEKSGMSVMEISHRSEQFKKIMARADSRLRKLLGISDQFAILYLQGGARLQFAMIPMNLYVAEQPVDVIHTGAWTKQAMQELDRCAKYRVVASGEKGKFLKLPVFNPADLNAKASYVYVCSNNTIFGTQWKKFPKTEAPLVADMTSDILSRPIPMDQFGMVFASAQKNLGIAGVTVVIIRKDLMERASKQIPGMLQYREHFAAESLYNTAPTFPIYVAELVLEWIENEGGLEAMEKRNQMKAKLLYDAIDKTDFYHCPVFKEDRSQMNVVFRVKNGDEALEKKFAEEASKAGLKGLKGHRSVGGLRASIYNAHPIEGVEALVTFMNEFQKKNQ